MAAAGTLFECTRTRRHLAIRPVPADLGWTGDLVHGPTGVGPCRSSAPASAGHEQGDSTEYGRATQDWRERHVFPLLRRRLDRAEIHHLLPPGEGEAAVGKNQHPERDQNNSCDERCAHHNPFRPRMSRSHTSCVQERCHLPVGGLRRRWPARTSRWRRFGTANRRTRRRGRASRGHIERGIRIPELAMEFGIRIPNLDCYRAFADAELDHAEQFVPASQARAR
jgi:hypothetical protein